MTRWWAFVRVPSGGLGLDEGLNRDTERPRGPTSFHERHRAFAGEEPRDATAITPEHFRDPSLEPPLLPDEASERGLCARGCCCCVCVCCHPSRIETKCIGKVNT